MTANKIFKQALNVKRIKINDARLAKGKHGNDIIMIVVELYKKDECKCPFYKRVCLGYDESDRESYWRSLDIGRLRTYISYRTKRVECPEHGVVTAYVPGSGFTEDFKMTAAWLSYIMNKSTIAEYMGIAWNTVGKIISRVRDKIEPDQSKRLDGLARIGVDETSYKKGHKYIMTLLYGPI